MLNRKAQGLIEYALIFAAIIAVVVATGIYVRRSMNAKLKRTAIGLNAVFTDINRVTMPTGIPIPGEAPVEPEPDNPGIPQETQDAINDLKALLDNGDLQRSTDLISQARDLIAAGDIAGARDLLDQTLALLNSIDFTELETALGIMEPGAPGRAEIQAGLTAFQQAKESANQVPALLDTATNLENRAADLASQAANLENRAADLASQAADLLNRANAAITPAERGALLSQRESVLREREAALGERGTALGERNTALQEKDAALNEAAGLLSSAIASLSSANDSFNTAIGLMEGSLSRPGQEP